jgi:molecular chaperone DnaK (HSP70)
MIHFNHTIITPKSPNVHDSVQISVRARNEKGEAQVIRISDVGHAVPSYVELSYSQIDEFIVALGAMRHQQVIDEISREVGEDNHG